MLRPQKKDEALKKKRQVAQFILYVLAAQADFCILVNWGLFVFFGGGFLPKLGQYTEDLWKDNRGLFVSKYKRHNNRHI
jgi:hypothetical protein